MPSFIFLLAYLTFITGVASFRIKIEPDQIQVPNTSIVTLTCSVEPSEPIAACQFAMWHVEGQQQGRTLEVTAREDNQVVDNHVDHFTADLYGGEGFFEQGLCAVTLRGVVGDRLLVGCKLTTQSQLSGIETASVSYSEDSLLSLHTTSNILFAEPESSVDILVQTTYGAGLTSCTSTFVNNETVKITQDNITDKNTLTSADGRPASPRFTSVGGMLSQGQCGFTISNVTEEESGVFFVSTEARDGSFGSKALILIVNSTNTTLIVWMVAALLVLVVVTTVWIMAYKRKLACFKMTLQPSSVLPTQCHPEAPGLSMRWSKADPESAPEQIEPETEDTTEHEQSDQVPLVDEAKNDDSHVHGQDQVQYSEIEKAEDPNALGEKDLLKDEDEAKGEDAIEPTGTGGDDSGIVLIEIE